MHKHIAHFNPDVMSLEQSHQDFSSEMKHFNAGKGYENFNDFMIEEAVEYKNAGDGVTYVVWNVMYDKNNNEIGRDVVSYYTLAATAIPYEDRIRLDEEDAKATGEEFDIEICGISAIEIKMFAVNEKYQDVFFEILFQKRKNFIRKMDLMLWKLICNRYIVLIQNIKQCI